MIDYLARHPIMLPYTTGIKRLDKIYLDTSCGIRGSEMKFPSKVKKRFNVFLYIAIANVGLA